MKPKKPLSSRKPARKASVTRAAASPAIKAKSARPSAVAKAKAKTPSTTAAPVAKTKATPTAAVSAAKTKTPAAASAAAPVAVPVAKAKAAPVATPAAAPVAATVAKAKTPPPTTTAAAPKAKPAEKSPAVKIPPILLEGDAPATPAPGGAGQRYALGPKPQSQPTAQAAVELPEAYGTQQLFLTARDPHWLYAHWDMTREQIKKHNNLSVDGHLILRVHRDALSGEPLAQIHLHPESRNWFVPVPDAGAKYLADLGYYNSARKWVSVTRSGATLTPPDSLSDDT